MIFFNSYSILEVLTDNNAPHFLLNIIPHRFLIFIPVDELKAFGDSINTLNSKLTGADAA